MGLSPLKLAASKAAKGTEKRDSAPLPSAATVKGRLKPRAVPRRKGFHPGNISM
jgi:hypothetical protein